MTEVEKFLARAKHELGFTTDGQLARWLGVHQSMLPKWKKQGYVPPARVEQIETAIRSGEKATAPPPSPAPPRPGPPEPALQVIIQQLTETWRYVDEADKVAFMRRMLDELEAAKKPEAKGGIIPRTRRRKPSGRPRGALYMIHTSTPPTDRRLSGHGDPDVSRAVTTGAGRGREARARDARPGGFAGSDR